MSFVSPTKLSFHYIGFVFIMVVAGGTGTLIGPVLGGLVFGVLPEVLRVAEQARNLLLGGILLVTIACLPEGLVGLWARVSSWRRVAREDAGEAAPDGERQRRSTLSTRLARPRELRRTRGSNP